ncbi:substrate-binding domain-containing protein [Microbulbifer celer]|uniref:Substrate-binding domain-containing protein n=1 Tax=Microbulbifer celer TaxID=435905 RepID=A0ABW3U4U2_9GAMM|nr:substrate-binding domain-containing protein [Microbulbifer celer]UFN57921.1 phosphate ABC transporter substrate-binding protein [Microbulbifer celer]
MENKHALLGGLLLAVITALPWLETNAAPARMETSNTPVTLFRMTGSNTIGADLAPALVKSWLETRGATRIRQRTRDERHWITADLNGTAVEIPIIALGSSTGFKALDQDTADIAMASRRIKDSEVNMLSRFGNLTSADAEHVIGLDALVIAVHKDNPVQQLTLEQLGGIYRGEIRNWQQLGGRNLPIQPLHRDRESGTRATFDKEVFGSNAPARSPADEVAGNHETRERVLNTPGAIGYVPFADAEGLHKVAIKAGQLAAVVPDAGIIATEDFPLTRRLYLYRNPATHHTDAADFLHFAESQRGQSLVADTGFINLTPVPLKMTPFANAPEGYRALMENGARLSISFRFADGSTELDNRALRDLQRLQDYMAKAENRDLSLTLVGFSDNRANSNIADLISRFRALKVQGSLLRDHRLGDSNILALGAFAPLTADSEQAPVKNSRVEVWIN